MGVTCKSALNFVDCFFFFFILAILMFDDQDGYRRSRGGIESMTLIDKLDTNTRNVFFFTDTDDVLQHMQIQTFFHCFS